MRKHMALIALLAITFNPIWTSVEAQILNTPMPYCCPHYPQLCNNFTATPPNPGTIIQSLGAIYGNSIQINVYNNPTFSNPPANPFMTTPSGTASAPSGIPGLPSGNSSGPKNDLPANSPAVPPNPETHEHHHPHDCPDRYPNPACVNGGCHNGTEPAVTSRPTVDTTSLPKMQPTISSTTLRNTPERDTTTSKPDITTMQVVTTENVTGTSSSSTPPSVEVLANSSSATPPQEQGFTTPLSVEPTNVSSIDNKLNETNVTTKQPEIIGKPEVESESSTTTQIPGVKLTTEQPISTVSNELSTSVPDKDNNKISETTVNPEKIPDNNDQHTKPKDEQNLGEDSLEHVTKPITTSKPELITTTQETDHEEGSGEPINNEDEVSNSPESVTPNSQDGNRDDDNSTEENIFVTEPSSEKEQPTTVINSSLEDVMETTSLPTPISSTSGLPEDSENGIDTTTFSTFTHSTENPTTIITSSEMPITTLNPATVEEGSMKDNATTPIVPENVVAITTTPRSEEMTTSSDQDSEDNSIPTTTESVSDLETQTSSNVSFDPITTTPMTVTTVESITTITTPSAQETTKESSTEEPLDTESLPTSTEAITTTIIPPVSPSIKIENSHLVVAKNGTVSFDVVVSGASEVKWSFNSKPINGVPCIVEDDHSCRAKYTKENVDVTDSGIFNITATNEGQSSSAVAETIVFAPVTVKLTRENPEEEQQYVSFDAIVSGVPFPEIKWEFNGRSIEGAPCTFDKNGACTAHFEKRNVSTLDTGIFNVTATNKYSSAHASARFNITLAPEIMIEEITQTIHENETLSINALVLGVPKPDVIWQLNGVNIKGPECVPTSIDMCKAHFIQTNATVKSSGNYTIIATNKINSVSKQEMITVTGAPKIQISNEKPNVAEHSATYFDALVTGVPSPITTWKFNGKEINGPKCEAVDHITCKARFTIDKAALSDHGSYEITASNKFGSSSAETHVAIMYPPKINKIGLTNVTLYEFETMSFDFAVTGLPKPQVQFKLGENLIDGVNVEEVREGLYNAKLLIHNVNENNSGIYHILASNDYGSDSAEVLATVIVRPSAPGRPKIMKFNNEIVELLWPLPLSNGGAPVKNYTVQMKTNESDYVNVKTVSGKPTTKIHGLSELDTYRFRIVATNRVGTGPPSEPTPPHTPWDPYRCKYNGMYYHHGQSLYRKNCNECSCLRINGKMQVDCEKNRCLADAELFETIQEEKATWKAANYSEFWGQTSHEGFRRYLGTVNVNDQVSYTVAPKSDYNPEDLPKKFDARVKWGNRIREIRDQDGCGASWAFSTLDVASDRIAIKTLGDISDLSAQQLLSCSGRYKKRVCTDGTVKTAWTYLQTNGLVTEKCYPWVGDHESCEQMTNAGEGCVNDASPRQELNKFSRAYRINSTESDIMYEIMTHGPVQASMFVYADLFFYKSGIYIHHPNVESMLASYTSVRIIGWGEEMLPEYTEPLKYWLVANSWGEEWGERGFLKIAKGINECGIEDLVIGVQAED